MKKSLKTFLSIFMSAILSFFIIPCASAHLNPTHKAKLDQLCSQHVDAYASDHLSEWRESLIGKIDEIVASNPHDYVIAAEAFVYVTSKITDCAAIRDLEIQSFSIFKSYSIDNQLQYLSCRITTMDYRMIILKI